MSYVRNFRISILFCRKSFFRVGDFEKPIDVKTQKFRTVQIGYFIIRFQFK